MANALPPYGKQFQLPRNGVQVAIGPGAWNFQKKHSSPIMVLPDDANPEDFVWPSDRNTALIYECGTYDDDRLEAMARTLLVAGSSSVVAHRSATLAGYPKLGPNIEDWEPENIKDFDLADIEDRLLDFYPEAYGDPMVYFYPEVQDVAA